MRINTYPRRQQTFRVIRRSGERVWNCPRGRIGFDHGQPPRRRPARLTVADAPVGDIRCSGDGRGQVRPPSGPAVRRSPWMESGSGTVACFWFGERGPRIGAFAPSRAASSRPVRRSKPPSSEKSSKKQGFAPGGSASLASTRFRDATLGVRLPPWFISSRGLAGPHARQPMRGWPAGFRSPPCHRWPSTTMRSCPTRFAPGGARSNLSSGVGRVAEDRSLTSRGRSGCRRRHSPA